MKTEEKQQNRPFPSQPQSRATLSGLQIADFYPGKIPGLTNQQTSRKRAQPKKSGWKKIAWRGEGGGGVSPFTLLRRCRGPNENFPSPGNVQKEIGQFQKEISILERKNVRVRERRTHAKGRLNAGSKEGKKRGRKGRSVAIRQGILGGLLLFAFWTALEGDF